ncbi:MAG TPA: RNA-directed DNA polymerase [Candidatus Fimihabitans intestinipullorum]|uniref:RNA-directed DNA polymerase n=1 Tax=Candidatus Fimihabitans intestinipullorum TaxID=2840820 RepID=A0A9D1HT34_9BACT|nr:RNA-directed DNA polymerase [Candidatus Fimihabitans intestinipullorum]
MWKYIGTKECNDFLLSLHLIDCLDQRKYIKTIYSISNNIEKNYKIYKIKKSNGGYRTIYEPNPLLKQIQKRILTSILNHKAISRYAKAYHKGTQLKDNAFPHVNKNMMLKLDIKNFFETITFLDIYNSCFSIEYFPKSVGMILTYLCTYDNHLTQGSPTSPYISNLVMQEFDEELGSWCDLMGISYTRYSDDMTFSGQFNPRKIISKVRKMLYRLGMELNDSKTHVVYKSSSQKVTGVVVNEKMQVSKRYRNKIRQEIYYIKKFGLNSHLKKCNIDINSITYVNILYGKILYVLQINETDKEFIKYKQFIKDLKGNIG